MNRRLNNLIKQLNSALDVFEKTGDRRQFIALQDQLHSFQKQLKSKRISKEILILKELIKPLEDEEETKKG